MVDALAYKAFRGRLREMRQRLQDDIAASETARVQQVHTPGELSNAPTHTADEDSEGVTAEVAAEERMVDELRSVNAALERMQDGTYGICADCGQAIPKERLEALPCTTRCTACEQKAEGE